MRSLHLYGITELPRIRPGDDLGGLLAEALRALRLQVRQGDILVVAHKVVSKAEGRVVDLARVAPSPGALELAAACGKDPRLCELILGESRAILRVAPGLVVAEHRLGFVCANAGIDRSNVAEPGEGGEAGSVVLLPADPDESARRLRFDIYRHVGVGPAVIICDTHGRAHREGAVGVSIGVAGLYPILREAGRQDLYGYTLRSSEEAVADELAGAATLVMGQADEGVPAVLVRGFFEVRQAEALAGAPGTGSGPLVRERSRDLFR